MRIIQISDTHVSREHDDFSANVALVGAEVAATAADLVIHTGDLSMNGAVGPDDLDDALAWMRTLPQPALWLPGNHDVGDLPDLRADQRLDDERLARYRDRAGDDRWMRDAGGWRLIGLDAMLCATATPTSTGNTSGWKRRSPSPARSPCSCTSRSSSTTRTSRRGATGRSRRRLAAGSSTSSPAPTSG